jgi:3-isopropylmalate/(R)-2-methylmalate dehydratase small subunit
LKQLFKCWCTSSAEICRSYFKAIEADPKTELEVNLPEQIITLKATGEKNLLISPVTKDNMINGFDDIDYLQNIRVVAFATSILTKKISSY